jgi:hypothetical protein
MASTLFLIITPLFLPYSIVSIYVWAFPFPVQPTSCSILGCEGTHDSRTLCLLSCLAITFSPGHTVGAALAATIVVIVVVGYLVAWGEGVPGEVREDVGRSGKSAGKHCSQYLFM